MNAESDESRHESDSEHGAVLTTTEARQGSTPRVTRYVLGWGLALVVVAFSLIYYLFAR